MFSSSPRTTVKFSNTKRSRRKSFIRIVFISVLFCQSFIVYDWFISCDEGVIKGVVTKYKDN